MIYFIKLLIVNHLGVKVGPNILDGEINEKEKRIGMQLNSLALVGCLQEASNLTVTPEPFMFDCTYHYNLKL